MYPIQLPAPLYRVPITVTWPTSTCNRYSYMHGNINICDIYDSAAADTRLLTLMRTADAVAMVSGINDYSVRKYEIICCMNRNQGWM